MKRMVCVAILAGLSVAAATARQAGVPAGETALGTVSLPRQVLADGRQLAAGTYDLRLTTDPAQPETPGQLGSLNRWVEFVQADEVRGREVANIIPSDEIGDVAGSALPGPGVALVQLLRGNDYLRIWINREGTHYLLHLPTS